MLYKPVTLIDQEMGYNMIEVVNNGRIQDFHLGGGGCKRLCARMDITSAEPNSLSAGVQGLLKGPGSSGVVLMLSRAI